MPLDNEFSNALSEESDRGAVLIVSTMLEIALVKLVNLRLIQDTNLKECGANNFSSKINMAYSLGIINEPTKNLYHSLRDIRNEFAHSADFLTLETDNLSKKFEKLFDKYPDFISTLENTIKLEYSKGYTGDFVTNYFSVRKKFDIVFSYELERLKIAESYIQRITPLITTG